MDFLAIWQFGPALFACKAPYHLDRVRKNADPLLKILHYSDLNGTYRLRWDVVETWIATTTSFRHVQN